MQTFATVYISYDPIEQKPIIKRLLSHELSKLKQRIFMTLNKV